MIVSVAASTNEVIEHLSGEFSKSTGALVVLNAGPSNALASQILAGAPADLFLSASARWSDEVEKAGQTADSIRLLTNQMVLVVPKGNPAQVREPDDLLSDRVQKLALAGENVPAGMYADQVLSRLGLLDQLVERGKIARGEDVLAALSYVERGEADAGIVYSSDVGVLPGVESVQQFDPQLHDEIVYVLVLTKLGGTKPAARRLFEFLQSPKADATYTRFGFVRFRGSASEVGRRSSFKE